MSTERDTHFAGFAQLLWDELKPDLQLDYLAGSLQDSWALVNEFEPLDLPALEERAKLLIAERAYDLVIHVLNHVPLCFPLGASMQPVPDLTTLPPAAPESAVG